MASQNVTGDRHFSVLPAINQATVWEEAKRLLLEYGGITDQELINTVVYGDPAISEACPEAMSYIRTHIVSGHPDLEKLCEQVEQWRRKLAGEALAKIYHSRQMEIIHDLRQRHASQGEQSLEGRMAAVLIEALSLADPDEGEPAVTLVASSALHLFHNLNIVTGQDLAHELGNRDHVPTHLTLAEVLDHSAAVAGATTPEREWVMLRAAQHMMRDFNEVLSENAIPVFAIQHETKARKIEHDESVRLLREMLDQRRAALQ